MDPAPRPPVDAPQAAAAAAWLRRGRYLVESRQGQTTSNMLDQSAAILPYLDHCRQRVAATGACNSAGCSRDNLEATPAGRLVCFRTRRPCPHFQLSLIATLWSRHLMTTTELTNAAAAIVPKAQAEQLAKIESLRQNAAAAIAQATADNQPVMRGIIVARAMQELRELLDERMMADVMALMNSPLGFLTDRDPNRPGRDGKKPTPYSVETVRDCAIVALLSGFSVTGNEWNIIGGKFYPAKDGCRRRVQEWPGLADLKIELGVPSAANGGALVAATASWTVNGTPYRIDCMPSSGAGDTDTRLAIRVNSGMGTDAILGKARRKLYALILERLTGISQADTGDNPAEIQPATMHAARLTEEQPDHPAAIDRIRAELDTTRKQVSGFDQVTDVRGYCSDTRDVIKQIDADPALIEQALDELGAIETERETEIRRERGK